MWHIGIGTHFYLVSTIFTLCVPFFSPPRGPQEGKARCVFCSTLLNFVFGGGLGINPAFEETTMENDDGICCQWCDQRAGYVSEFGACHLNMWASYMPFNSGALQS